MGSTPFVRSFRAGAVYSQCCAIANCSRSKRFAWLALPLEAGIRSCRPATIRDWSRDFGGVASSRVLLYEAVYPFAFDHPGGESGQRCVPVPQRVRQAFYSVPYRLVGLLSGPYTVLSLILVGGKFSRNYVKESTFISPFLKALPF